MKTKVKIEKLVHLQDGQGVWVPEPQIRRLKKGDMIKITQEGEPIKTGTVLEDPVWENVTGDWVFPMSDAMGSSEVEKDESI